MVEMDHGIFTMIAVEFKEPELVPLDAKFKHQFIEYLLGESKNIQNVFIPGERDFKVITILARWTEMTDVSKFLTLLKENPYIGSVKSFEIYKPEKSNKVLVQDKDMERRFLKEKKRGMFDFLK